MMKRILCLLFCAALLLAPGGALSLNAAAEGTEDAPAAGETGDTPAPPKEPVVEQNENAEVHFLVDTNRVYDGMERPYGQGYTPTVENGTAILVLPLIAEGELAGDCLTVSLDLGDPAASPFVYRNYRTEFHREALQREDGAVQALYLIRFDLDLTEERQNGAYPITMNITARDTHGAPVEAGYTTYVTISDAAPEPEPVLEDITADTGSVTAAPAAVEKPTSQPVILIDHVSLEAEAVEAGQDFTACVTLRNTSAQKPVQNMVVTISAAQGLTLRNDSNTSYISSIPKGGTAELEVCCHVERDSPEGTYEIALSMSYDNSDAETLSSQGSFLVAVTQPLEVEFTTSGLNESITAGDTLPFSVQVMNLGRSRVYNVRCELSGDGIRAMSTGFVGTLEAGTDGSASINLYAGPLSSGEYGPTEVTMTLTYENEAGELFTQTETYQTEITQPVITAAAVSEEEPESAGTWWLSILIGGIVVAALAAVLIVGKIKRG